ncbi:zinc finger protein 300 [Diachasma alloeum]|uniref:zinc finger protein 300 n=1 Tax=Diachasma alloeum TaxID=454923 RepID=UPI000738134A|nr:zinc finger protein 300 [Diachasma alloeum]
MSVREVVNLSRGLANVSEMLKDAIISQTYADVILCCTGGQKFSAHRLVLSAASPYLERVLSAHENTTCLYEPITVILPDLEGNDLAAVLGFIYTGYTAVSGDRLEAFSSTAQFLNIKIPPLPSETRKWEKYYHDIGINMTINNKKFNEKEYFRGGIFYRMSSGSAGEQLLYENNCLNLEKKQKKTTSSHGLRDERRPRLYVANRVSASPWCQMLQPHHLSQSQPIIILKNNNKTPSEDTIQTQDVESLQLEKLINNKLPTDESRSSIGLPYSSLASHIQTVVPTAEVCPPQTTTATSSSPAAVCQKIINADGPRDEDDVSLMTLLVAGEPAPPASMSSNRKINMPSIEYSDDSNSARNQLRCQICDKNFTTRASLKVHPRLMLHSLSAGEQENIKLFRCKLCGKGFSQLRNYKYHTSIHEGTGEFSATCPECGKSFNDRGYLGSHMKIHNNRKEYSCGECGKSFNQRVAYNMHVKIHSGVKPHRCDQCGKAFSRNILLKQHLRTHTGERPYQCDICQKAFADRSNMRLHTRLHSGLKPYQCHICSKAFTKKHHLKTHLNYHAGIKPYSCPNCSLAFSQSSNMRTHFKRCSINNK